ncbi:MAG: hypothetical protein ABIP78_12630 [Pyrinomonadaceae bacterium]
MFDDAPLKEADAVPKIDAYAIAGGESMRTNLDETTNVDYDSMDDVASSAAFNKHLPVIATAAMLLLIILVNDRTKQLNATQDK